MSDRRNIHKIYKERKAMKKACRGQTLFKPVKIEEYPEDTQKLIMGRVGSTVSRNSKCPCGSRKRFKRCHGKKKVIKNG